MRRWIKRIIIAIAVLVLIFIAQGVIALEYNIWCFSKGHYICRFCRADLRRETAYWVPLPDKIQEGPFSRYYKQEVDPKHKHTWGMYSISTKAILGGGFFGDGGPSLSPPLRLDEKPTWAILKSLPNPASRRKFMDKLYFPKSHDNPKYREVASAVDNLRDAYYADPDRKDWPQLLRKYDLYPE